MARSGSYKTYTRSRRLYTLENTFTGGMKYSNAPLDEGQMRQIINFDLSNDRKTLSPRLGLRYSNVLMENCSKTSDNTLQPKLVNYTASNEKQRTISFDRKDTVCFGFNDASTNTHLNQQLHPEITDFTVNSLHNIPFTDSIFHRFPGTVAYNNAYYTFDNKDMKVLHDGTDGSAPVETLAPRILNASEASMYGYNMLSEAPYDFSNEVISGTEAQFTLNGILPYDTESNTIKFDPRINEFVRFRAFYQATPGTYYYTWRTRTADDDTYSIVKVGTFSVATGTAPQLEYTVAIPHKSVFIELCIYACVMLDAEPVDNFPGKDSTIYYMLQSGSVARKWYWSSVDQKYIKAEQQDIISDVPVFERLENSFNFSDSETESMRGMKFINYDLSTSLGMTYWNGSLVCYAPHNGENILFLSSYNEPEFFPYPNNTDIFDESIRYCVTYLNDLLVFTETQLWRLVRSTTGTGWTKSLIQGNLNISDFDINFIQVVKNMVYFKSADNYFMVVPKSQSTTGELTLAPVSRSLDVLFHDFKSGIIDMLSRTYDQYGPNLEMKYSDAEIFIRDAYCYLDYEDVHNVYMLQINYSGVTEYITLELLYNTVVRYWRAYFYQSYYALMPYTADATKSTNVVALTPGASSTGSYYWHLWLVERTDNRADALLTEASTTDTLTILPAKLVTTYKNWQLFDSGQHDYMLESKKRFRELQFFIHNLSDSDLTFNLGFLLDGSERFPIYKYVQTTTVDPDTGQATTYLDRQAVLTADVPSTINTFTLNQTDAGQVQLWKIRTGISGKGYAPRFLFLSKNEKEFSFIDFIWVYRMMYLR